MYLLQRIIGSGSKLLIIWLLCEFPRCAHLVSPAINFMVCPHCENRLCSKEGQSLSPVVFFWLVLRSWANYLPFLSFTFISFKMAQSYLVGVCWEWNEIMYGEHLVLHLTHRWCEMSGSHYCEIQDWEAIRCTGFPRVAKKGNKEQALAFILIDTSKQLQTLSCPSLAFSSPYSW